MNKTICELFAGVGGFRLGFERAILDGRLHGFRNGNQVRGHNGQTNVIYNILEIYQI